MPLRLLGLAEDPSQVGELCGDAFRTYSASGVTVTIEVLEAVALARSIVDAVSRAKPDVVVAQGQRPGFSAAVFSAFLRARAQQGRGRPPAKLYFRARPPLSPLVTTMLSRGRTTEPELFVRAFPQPWLSGILERDLFAGIRGEPACEPGEAIAS